MPVPTGEDVLEALVSALVISASSNGPGVLHLVSDNDRRSRFHTVFLLSGGAPAPMVRAVIAARVNGVESVLIDGVIITHEITPGPAPGTARLSVTGEDLSRVMDYLDLSGIPYRATPDFVRVAIVVAKYAFLGVALKATPAVLPDIPQPTDRIARHQGADLVHMRMLADKVGHLCMMQPGPTRGTSFAYWGPEIRRAEIQPALNFDMDAHTNVIATSGAFDSQSAKLPIVFIQNPQTKVLITIVANLIVTPPTGAIPPIPLQLELITGTAKYNPIQGALIGVATAAKANKAPVKVSGGLDVARYGRLLEPHKIVGLRGFGAAFNGLHYVEMAKTSFAEGSLTQNFELSRNGRLSTVETAPA